MQSEPENQLIAVKQRKIKSNSQIGLTGLILTLLESCFFICYQDVSLVTESGKNSF